MSTRIQLLAVAAVASAAVSCDLPRIAWCKEISMAEVARKELNVESWPEDLPDRSLSCSIGAYVVVTPSTESTADNIILLRGGDLVFVRQGGFNSILQQGRPTVDVTDSNNDGLFDRVSYSVFGVGGWDEIRVADNNLDAQPDMRAYHRRDNHEYWLWVEDGWYKTPRLGSMHVLVGDAAKPYETIDGRFVFAAESRITMP